MAPAVSAFCSSVYRYVADDFYACRAGISVQADELAEKLVLFESDEICFMFHSGIDFIECTDVS